MNHGLRLLAGIGVLLVATVTACGEDDDSAAGGSGNDGPTVEIVEPADGGSVSIPFMLDLDSSVELGPTDAGLHHVHVFFDGDDSAYEVVESDTVEIGADSPAVAGLTPGEHVLNVSLRNADHSAAGAETQVTINVDEAGAPTSPNGESDTPDYSY